MRIAPAPRGRGALARWRAAALAIAAASSALGIASLAAAAAGAAPSPAGSARVEARSAQLLAVGTVHGERMIIHLSRIEDNAPIRDAQIDVVLRGATHAAVADADGSYSVDSPDFALPGAAAVEFRVAWAGTRHNLEGTLQGPAGPAETSTGGSSRQIGWWVLNFAVCIGFLWLWSRRKRHDADEASS